MAERNDSVLSTQDRWEASYRPPVASGLRERGKQFLRRQLGEDKVALFKDYDAWLLWEVLYPRYLPRGPGLRALEIGSAPGTHLLELRRRFGYEPFGVEYTAAGAEANRAQFTAHGVNPANVYEADVFSADLRQRCREQFDLVLSRGFIEHFGDPKAVVGTHLEFLKPGGTLIIEVPNFHGIHYPWYLLFRRSVLTWHNFNTMRWPVFKSLFDTPGLERLYLGSYGTFSFTTFMLPRNRVGRVLGALRSPPQALRNAALRVGFPQGGPESGLTSPRHLFIGRKL